MRVRMIPLLFMLLAGAVTSIICYKLHYEIKAAMFILLGVMFLFFLLGDLVRFIWNKTIVKDEDKDKEGEGEEASEQADSVIEKEGGAGGKAIETGDRERK